MMMSMLPTSVDTMRGRALPLTRTVRPRQANLATRARRGEDMWERLFSKVGESIFEDVGRVSEEVSRAARSASSKYSEEDPERARQYERMASMADAWRARGRAARDSSSGNCSPRASAERAPGSDFRVDIVESETGYDLYADVPGLSKSDLKIKVDAKTRQLTIKGERRRPVEVEKLDSEGKPSFDGKRILERPMGGFERSFVMSKKCDLEAITARVEKGVLHLTVEKKPQEEPTTVEVPVWD